MKTDSIKDQVRGFYASQKLPPESLERIKSRISEAGYQSSKARSRSFRHVLQDLVRRSFQIRLVPAMATALTIFVMFNLAVWYQWHRSTEQGLSTRIAREIAMNHVKNLQPEIQSASIEGLQKVMPSLDFKPFTPEVIKRMGLVLKGARYCTIQGNLAVHMQLKDASGKLHSVYQAPCPPKLQKIKRTVVNLDNVQITMWNENGIFMGLAGPRDHSPMLPRSDFFQGQIPERVGI